MNIIIATLGVGLLASSVFLRLYLLPALKSFLVVCCFILHCLDVSCYYYI